MAAVVVSLLSVSLLWQRICGFSVISPLERLRRALRSCDFLSFPQMPDSCSMSLLCLAHLTYVCVRTLRAALRSGHGKDVGWLTHPGAYLFTYVFPVSWSGICKWPCSRPTHLDGILRYISIISFR